MTSGKQWYLEQLKDPRWQRKRLEIMQRDNFACVTCADVTTELQIDHKFYIKGASPWEYPDDALQTLCRNCHEIKSEIEGSIKVKTPVSKDLPKPPRFQCLEAFLLAYVSCRTALKIRVMELYARGILPAGSVERIFTKRGLRDS